MSTAEVLPFFKRSFHRRDVVCVVSESCFLRKNSVAPASACPARATKKKQNRNRPKPDILSGDARVSRGVNTISRDKRRSNTLTHQGPLYRAAENSRRYVLGGEVRDTSASRSGDFLPHQGRRLHKCCVCARVLPRGHGRRRQFVVSMKTGVDVTH